MVGHFANVKNAQEEVKKQKGQLKLKLSKLIHYY